MKMPAYKDEKKKTWYVKFSYKSWNGTTSWVTKRGFRTKSEAQSYEEEFKRLKGGSLEMTFADFAQLYKQERSPRLKDSTMGTKSHIIDTKLIPYFGNRKVCDITASDVMKWQNELLKLRDPDTGKPYSASYLKTVHNQLSAIFNHAVRFYKLHDNPAKIAGNMGSEKNIHLNFWTLEEYRRFSDAMMARPVAFYCFEVLYWTGIREGELLALTIQDFDFKSRTLTISKTYHRSHGEDIITSPKTEKSNRVIVLPVFLCEEIQEYFRMLYQAKPADRLFPVSKGSLTRWMKDGAEQAGVKHIRVHDLRHSHVSLLIQMGYSAVAIADRLGHESVEITYRYAHLFPTVQADMAGHLDDLKGE